MNYSHDNNYMRTSAYTSILSEIFESNSENLNQNTSTPLAKENEPNKFPNFNDPQNDLNSVNNIYNPSQGESSNPYLFTMHQTANRFILYADNPLYIFIKAKELRNISISQSWNKWVFSPYTEKKIIYYSQIGKQIKLLYYAEKEQMIAGIAEYQGMIKDQNLSKPTASIKWIFNKRIKQKRIIHIVNPYDSGTPIVLSKDGAVIRQDVAQSLIEMFTDAE